MVFFFSNFVSCWYLAMKPLCPIYNLYFIFKLFLGCFQHVFFTINLVIYFEVVNSAWKVWIVGVSQWFYFRCILHWIVLHPFIITSLLSLSFIFFSFFPLLHFHFPVYIQKNTLVQFLSFLFVMPLCQNLDI